MENIVKGEVASLPVLQPFLGGLVPANIEIPRELWHVAETLGGVEIHAAILVHQFFHKIVAAGGELGNVGH